MDIKERLKTLKYDPLYRTALDDEISKSWQRNLKIKHFLTRSFNIILKELYQPLGCWKQNPNTTIVDIGVVIDGKWSQLMQTNTNYSSHTMIFNKCNKLLLDLYRKQNIEEIKVEDEVFSYKTPIVFNINDGENDILTKIIKMLKLVRYFKFELFHFSSDVYKELLVIFNKYMELGDVSLNFYEKHIHKFFDDIIEFTITKGSGDIKDRFDGIDVWKTHNDRKTTDQIKRVSNIVDNGHEYFLDTVINLIPELTYHVFVSKNNRITIFYNDLNKIKMTKDGVYFAKELLYKDLIINE
jgi:hypothetical protein